MINGIFNNTTSANGIFNNTTSVTGINGGTSSWNGYWPLSDSVLFFAETSKIIGDKLYNQVVGTTDYLTIAGSPNTFQCPNTAAYIAADTDKIWFTLLDAQRTVTSSELITYDLQRTPVRYADSSPHGIEAIMILKAGATLTTNQLNYLFRTFKLHPLWNDAWNDNGALKENRGLEQILWTPI